VDTIAAPQGTTIGQRLINALHYGFIEMAQNIGKWLIIGLLIAAAITVFVPDGFFTTFASYPLLSMIAVVVVAVPMYVCSTGSIPIALSLMIKGLTPGAAFVLLMAGPAANFASIVIVSKALGRRTAIVYLSTIVIGAIAFGLCIDYLLPQQWFAISATSAHIGCHISATPFQLICTAILITLMVYAFIIKYKSANNRTIMENNQTFVVKGMTCGHCKAMVEKNIGKLNGVEGVEADLATGKVCIKGHADEVAVREVVEDLGFTLI
ncbi:MAG: permease, partial [Muribaculaceae bacterium]|nr:permease [Muribaculaceae bacterium]